MAVQPGLALKTQHQSGHRSPEPRTKPDLSGCRPGKVCHWPGVATLWSPPAGTQWGGSLAWGRHPQGCRWRAPAGLPRGRPGPDPDEQVRGAAPPGPWRAASPDDVGQDEQLHGAVHEPHFTAADEHDARRVVLEEEGAQYGAAARHGRAAPRRSARLALCAAAAAAAASSWAEPRPAGPAAPQRVRIGRAREEAAPPPRAGPPLRAGGVVTPFKGIVYRQ